MSDSSQSSPPPAMTGGLPPRTIVYAGISLPNFPPLVDDVNGRMEAIQSLNTRDDDIFLVAYVKSGTHWLWEIMYMLLNGKAEYSKESKENVFIEAIDDLEAINSRSSPRVLNTHLPYRLLPRKHIQNKGKVVHIVRNPKDIMVSHFHHLKLYGDYGPVPSNIEWSDFFTHSMKNQAQVYGRWFEYEKELLKYEENDTSGSIMKVHFEELKRNTDKEIKRLADFLGVECSDELAADIVERTNFQNLKLADDNIKTDRVEDPVVKQIKITMGDNKAVVDLKSPSLFRKVQIKVLNPDTTVKVLCKKTVAAINVAEVLSVKWSWVVHVCVKNDKVENATERVKNGSRSPDVPETWTISETNVLKRRETPTLPDLGEIGDWKNHFKVAQNELFDSVYETEMKDSNLKVAFE